MEPESAGTDSPAPNPGAFDVYQNDDIIRLYEGSVSSACDQRTGAALLEELKQGDARLEQRGRNKDTLDATGEKLVRQYRASIAAFIAEFTEWSQARPTVLSAERETWSEEERHWLKEACQRYLSQTPH